MKTALHKHGYRTLGLFDAGRIGRNPSVGFHTVRRMRDCQPRFGQIQDNGIDGGLGTVKATIDAGLGFLFSADIFVMDGDQMADLIIAKFLSGRFRPELVEFVGMQAPRWGDRS